MYMLTLFIATVEKLKTHSENNKLTPKDVVGLAVMLLIDCAYKSGVDGRDIEQAILSATSDKFRNERRINADVENVATEDVETHEQKRERLELEEDNEFKMCGHTSIVAISATETQCMDCLRIWPKEPGFKSDWPQHDRD